MVPTDRYMVDVKLPLGDFARSFADAADKPDVLARFPDAKKGKGGLTLLEIHLDTAEITVDGFGCPFANAEDPEVEGWINDGKPIVESHSLIDILRTKDFYLVVAFGVKETEKEWAEGRMPPPFAYPYGNEHSFEVDRMKELLQKHKGGRFRPAYG